MFLVLFQFAATAQQTYQLDVKKSKILWDNRKTMGGHHGYILFSSGMLNFLPGGESGSGVFSINMNSMAATDDPKAGGNESTNRKLREDNYFAIDKYPVATMTVKQIAPTGKPLIYRVTGDLTIKSSTNPVDFTATLITKGNTIEATATTTIDRLKWHIDMQSPNQPWQLFGAIQNKLISDQILIKLNLVFIKAE